MRRLTIPEFHAELKAQGVPNQNHAALKCPICGTVQSMADFVAAGEAHPRFEIATPAEAQAHATRNIARAA